MPSPRLTIDDMADRSPKMADVARAAGYSVMTVSYALRGHPKIPSATREKIRRTADAMGYVKHPMVAALMAARRSGTALRGETVALLTKFDRPVASWKSPRSFYSDLHSGMVARGRELGFRIEEFPTFGPGAPSADRLTRILRARGIRGVILMPGGGLERPFPDLDLNGLVVVAAAFHAREMPVHRTASDHGWAMGLAIEKAFERGYRRIGLAMNHRLDPEVRYAFSGRFLAWQQTRPAQDRVPLIAGRETSVAREAFARWSCRYRPDCIVLTDPELLPACDRAPGAPGCIVLPVRGNRRVAGVDTVPAEVGRSTVSLLARELYLNHVGPPPFPEVILVKGRWQNGPSLPRRTAKTQP